MPNKRVDLIREIKALMPGMTTSRFDTIYMLEDKLKIYKSLKNVNALEKTDKRLDINRLLKKAAETGAIKNPITQQKFINSDAINKYLSIGYKLGVNQLNSNIRWVNIKSAAGYLSKNEMKQYNIFKVIITANLGKGDKEYLFTGQINNNDKFIANKINEWIYTLLANTEINREDAITKIEIKLAKFRNNREDLEPEFGPAFKGVSNCVINSLSSFKDLKGIIESKKYLLNNIVKDGVFKEDYEKLAKELKIKLRVHINNNKIIYNSESKKRGYDLYYFNNHVVAKVTPKEEKETILCEKINITDKDLINCVNCNYEDGEFIYFETLDKIYIKNHQIINKKRYDIIDTISPVTQYKNLFINKNEIFSFSGEDSINFCKHGIMLKKINYMEGNTIDLKGAYRNFENFPSYDGMPFSIDIITNETNLDLFLNKYAGLALVKCVNPITLKEEIRYLTIPMINHRIKIGYSPITYYKWFLSIRKGDYDMTMFTKEDKTLFIHMVGLLSKCYKEETAATTDYILARDLELPNSYHFNEGILYYGKTKNKKFKPNYSYVSAYIQQYTEIEMEKLYMQIKDRCDIYMVYVDGISINTKYNDNLDYLNYDKDLFSVKPNNPNMKGPEELLINFEDESKVISLDEDTINYADCTKFIDVSFSDENQENNNFLGSSKNKFIIGGPGTGKSTKLKLLNETYGWPILTQSNLQKTIYKNAMTVDYVMERQERYAIVLIDEYFMMDAHKLNYFSNCICVGDPNQLNVTQNKINYKAYNYLKLEKVYRFNFILKQCLESVLKGKLINVKKISIKDALKSGIQILAPTHEKINEINKIGLSLNIERKVRFCKSNKKEDYYTGDIGIETKQGILNLRNNRYYKIKVSNYFDENAIIKYAFALTYHSTQGLEFPEVACVYDKNKYDRKMLYVGFSRVKKLENIYHCV